MDTKDYYTSKGWDVVHTISIPPRRPKFFQIDDLTLSQPTNEYLRNAFPDGIYRHQKEAIQTALVGKNVCMTTGAASGKSLCFYVTAIERLIQSPNSRVIAIYPLKALGREQEDRWKSALTHVGLPENVGRIDGQVPMRSRPGIVRNSRVLILTPDIVHAWLLSNLTDKSVQNLLRNLALMIVDEVHTYTGVFGSNAAFLFRRIQHVTNLLGALPQYFCASATISDPHERLKKLFGFDFTVIGPGLDTSPRHLLDIELVVPPRSAALLTAVSDLLHHLASGTSSRFLAFVDSRKQTEHITSIVARSLDKSVEEDKADKQEEFDHLLRLEVLPYRAGYEEHDRDLIQNRLSKGSLRGVVSTSALELGIDIPYLDAGVLIGVPRSATSLWQRIGRVGRHSDGKVIVINAGGVYDETVFRKPNELLKRPMAEAALYLENSRIQYIHALCLARYGGEHDQISSVIGVPEESEFSSSVDWPDGFIDLCKRERVGEIPADLQSMKMEGGEDPNHTYPLRDVESQFSVELKQGPLLQRLGSLSHGQLMREAYPGAVYYYTTRPFRVYKVNLYTKLVQARRERRYTTSPQSLPTLVFPNLTLGNVYQSKIHDDLITADCNLQIRESICGFKERRGPNEYIRRYPMAGRELSIYFNQPRFTRNYFTSGVVITHPALDRERVQRQTLAHLLYEAFLILIPFERRDINFASDKHRIQRGPIVEGSHFICVYDQTYGSLRLSSRILEGDTLSRTLAQASELSQYEEIPEINPETVEAIELLYLSSLQEGSDLWFEPELPLPTSAGRTEPVILPGSKGLNRLRNNEEVVVSAVFFSPSVGGLCYRGKYEALFDDTVEVIIPIAHLATIPGESKIGRYNYDAGEIEIATSSAAE